MIYSVIITIVLASGQPHTISHDCRGLPCVAYLMVAANEGNGLARVQVTRGRADLLPGGKRPVLPAWLDFRFQ